MYIKKIIKKYRSTEIMTLKEINDILKNNKNVILLDVRSKQEYKEGHLIGSVNIPVYDLEVFIDNIKKDAIIIVYCQSGIRSKKAIEILNKNGYKNLYHLKNGLDGI